MKKKIIVIMSIALFLLITPCFSIFAYADEIQEKENVIVQPYDIEAEWLLFTSKDREIHFNVTSNQSVNIYIMTSDAYYDLLWSPYYEEDFSINVLEKKNLKIASFTWTQPDDQSYYLVIFNPNNISAKLSYSYTETLFEDIEEAFTIFGEICAGTVCFILVVFDLVISIVIAIWMYKDANERGKNGALWGIFGFVLNIISLIIWLIVRPPISKVSETKSSDRRCPNCGRIIPEDSIVCPYCNKRFKEFLMNKHLLVD